MVKFSKTSLTFPPIFFSLVGLLPIILRRGISHFKLTHSSLIETIFLCLRTLLSLWNVLSLVQYVCQISVFPFPSSVKTPSRYLNSCPCFLFISPNHNSQLVFFILQTTIIPSFLQLVVCPFFSISSSTMFSRLYCVLSESAINTISEKFDYHHRISYWRIEIFSTKEGLAE